MGSRNWHLHTGTINSSITMAIAVSVVSSFSAGHGTGIVAEDKPHFWSFCWGSSSLLPAMVYHPVVEIAVDVLWDGVCFALPPM